MELYNKKRDDGIWIDEVEALQAYSPSEFSYFEISGITLAAEHSNITQDIRRQNDNATSHGCLDTNQDEGLLEIVSLPIKVGVRLPQKQVEEVVGSWERHHNSTSLNKKKQDGKKRNNSSGNISNGASKEDAQDEATNIDHPCIKEDGEASDEPLDNAIPNKLKNFRAMNKFKKVAL
ncbi:hypothetical protein FXO37_04413 [Capsicum annuum]|nr:hypothetical protein FXO37_04413 [Capsicum annuum]